MTTEDGPSTSTSESSPAVVKVGPGATAISAVDLILGAKVPNVVGDSVRDAASAIAARGLVPTGLPAGAPDTVAVQRQEPAAGTFLRLGDPVTEQPRPNSDGVPERSMPSPVTVAVPSVVGLDPSQAGNILSASGLILSATGVGSGTAYTAVQQDPQFGARVAPGSTVSVRFAAEQVAAASERFPVALLTGLVALGLALLAVCWLCFRSVRARRQRRWAGEHVVVRAGGQPVPAIHLDDPDPGRHHTVRLEPHSDFGAQTLQETRR